ncbi:GNAT family N-acetyltransferase [Kribbella sp. NPDC051952]|uniref:GNAT family N-acetyltransferase n=1 Tax=Kribbella sp. NPDC051952 TaxID=3154851 RepID=UPI0034254C38
MTTAVLPTEYTVRPPVLADSGAIFGLISAYNTAVIGFADCTLTDITEGIADPAFEPQTDGWLVVDREDVPVGYATTFGKASLEEIEIEVVSQDLVVAGWLFDRSMQRAEEMRREGGHAHATVDTYVYRADEPLRALLSEHDFSTGTTFNRMRIDHTGPVATPEVPAGVVVRRGAYDDLTRQLAHDVIIECFTGQFGFTARPHEEWLKVRESHPDFSWDQFTLLEIDGKVVAFRDCSDRDLATENCGHVGGLGVIEAARGRGLATYLLRDTFALDAAAGRAGTILHVDTNNPTPALHLYLSVGMRPTLVLEGWRRTIPATR